MLQKSCLRVVGYLLIAGAASLSPQMLLGQTTQLRGRVLDQSNAVIPGVALALTNQATQISHTAWSDEEGRYQFLELPPGNFTLLTEHPGFKVNIVRDIRLEVNFPAAMDVLLEVGTVQETITVEGLHDSVNRVDGSLGNTMTPEQIQGIPLNARNLAAALSLQPGVTPDGEVTGSRSDQLTLTLDGINVNDQFLQVTDSGTPFQPILRVTPDSIQEFRVVTSNPGARLGRSSGAQVSLITRSGTNDFHGSLYLYHRNKVTAANRFFNNRVEGDPDQDGEPGIGRPNLIRNVFGGSVGGPVVQNRAFFFFNYERRTDRSETSVAQPVPLAHLGEGKMRYLGREGQPIELGPDDMATLYPATGGVNEAVTRVFADAARRYPANEPGTVDFNWGIYRFNRATPLDWNSYTAKLDFNITQTLRLFLRGNYQWDHSDRGGKWPDSTVSPKTWSHPMGLSAGQTWTIRPTLINDFRYGLTRQAATWFGDTSQNWINIGFSPWSQLGDISSCVPVQNFTNDTSWVLGSHTLQFGANIRLISASDVDSRQSYDGGNTEYIWAGGWDAPIIDTELMYGPGQQFVYREAAAALLGRFTHYWNNYNFDVDGTLLPQGQENRRTYATQEYEFYFADSWQLSPKLTLNLGLRWGVNTPVSETTGYQVQPTVSLDDYFERRKASAQQGVPLNELLTIDRSGPYYDRPGYYSTDWNNLAPRISFAYSPSFDSGALQKIFGSTGQSVIRGGFAVMYDRIGTRLAWSFDKDNALGFHSAASIPTQTYHVMHNPGPSFTGWGQDIRGFPSLPPPEEISFPLTQFPDGSNNLGSSLDDAITSPVNYNWNLSIGRELPGGMFLEVAYVGRIARNLLASRDILQPNNIVDPSSGMDWYTAAAALSEYRENNVPISQVPEIPFFENLFPDLPATWWWSWDPSLSSTQNVFAFVSR
ncbi:MAG: TonB-dependent receptor, partial [Acidobacteriota bacterium]